VAAGIEVSAVPGPSALLAALVVSGLPTGRFVMEGFLPRKGAARRARLAELATEPRTIVLYESPRRIGDTLVELEELVGPDRQVVVARELTKLHEELWRGSLGEAAAHFAQREVRGEVVVVLAGAAEVDPEPPSEAQILAALEQARARGRSNRDAAAEVAAELGLPKRSVYDLAIGRVSREG
jgi:16S rRNA (cytidine1402-2'-O)-methyltransferase